MSTKERIKAKLVDLEVLKMKSKVELEGAKLQVKAKEIQLEAIQKEIDNLRGQLDFWS